MRLYDMAGGRHERTWVKWQSNKGARGDPVAAEVKEMTTGSETKVI